MPGTTVEEIDGLLEKLEQSLIKIDKVQGSSVKLDAAQNDCLSLIEKARDAMMACLQDKTDHGTRPKLTAIFGGDCARISKMRSFLEACHFTGKHAVDKRLEMCIGSCGIVEGVLREKGMTDKLRDANKLFIPWRGPAAAEAAQDKGPSKPTAGYEPPAPAQAVAPAPSVKAPRIPEWAADGAPVMAAGRKGDLVVPAPGGEWKIRWEDGTTEGVGDWGSIEEAPSSPVPGWVAGGQAVVHGGRRGVITSGGPGEPWKIQWEDAATEELIFDWAGIVKAAGEETITTSAGTNFDEVAADVPRVLTVTITSELDPAFDFGPGGTMVMEMSHIMVNISTTCEPAWPSNAPAFPPTQDFKIPTDDLKKIVFDPDKPADMPGGTVQTAVVGQGEICSNVPDWLTVQVQRQTMAPWGSHKLLEGKNETELHYEVEVESTVSMGDGPTDDSSSIGIGLSVKFTGWLTGHKSAVFQPDGNPKAAPVR